VLVVEGAELLSVALEAGVTIESVFVAPEGRQNPAVAAVVERAFSIGTRVFDLDPGVIERIADTVTPQPVLAVVGFVPTPLEEVRSASMVIVCADVRDPGNAGTMVRTADASGSDAVVFCDGTVDPTNPKTVRASAGSIFHVPVVTGGEAAAVVATLQGWGFSAVGTAVRDGTDYTELDWCRPTALVFGNEASGLDPSLVEAMDDVVTIPMAGRAESLNVGVSAAVLGFEALRQRRTAGGPGPRTAAGPGPRPTIPGMDAP
jgi:RNA methyltransferase, TrmH family